MEACPRTPLTNSQLPTLNVHYRTFFVSKEHAPYPLKKLAAFFVFVAMDTDIFKLFLL